MAIKMPSAAETAAARDKKERENSIVQIKQLTDEINEGKADANTYHHLATAFLGMKDVDKAQKAFEKALELDPKFLHAYVNLAVVHHEKGEFEKGIEYNHKALEISAGFIPARVNLAMSLMGIKDFKQAIEELEMVLKTEPKLPMALAGLFQAHTALNHRATAIKYRKLAEKAGVVFRDTTKES